MTRLGFIGTGHMGQPMAANLLRAGHELTVHDVRKEAAELLLADGARWADSAAAVAAAGEVVFLSLPLPGDVESAVGGTGGVLAGATEGTAIVDLSTNSPSVVRSLAALAAERGVEFMDAPVSGGVGGARKGSLAVMVGGEATAFERVRPLLEVIGERVFHVGPVGAGNVVKLINNMLFFIAALGTTEALVLGAKAGVDPNVLRDVVQAGSGASFAWDYGTRAILKDRLAPSFTVALAAKDIDLALDLADEMGITAAMGQRARDLITGYRDGGFAADDILAVVKGLEEQAGTVVRGRFAPGSPADST